MKSDKIEGNFSVSICINIFLIKEKRKHNKRNRKLRKEKLKVKTKIWIKIVLCWNGVLKNIFLGFMWFSVVLEILSFFCLISCNQWIKNTFIFIAEYYKFFFFKNCGKNFKEKKTNTKNFEKEAN